MSAQTDPPPSNPLAGCAGGFVTAAVLTALMMLGVALAVAPKCCSEYDPERTFKSWVAQGCDKVSV